MLLLELFYEVVYCWKRQTSPSQSHGRECSSMFRGERWAWILPFW